MSLEFIRNQFRSTLEALDFSVTNTVATGTTAPIEMVEQVVTSATTTSGINTNAFNSTSLPLDNTDFLGIAALVIFSVMLLLIVWSIGWFCYEKIKSAAFIVVSFPILYALCRVAEHFLFSNSIASTTFKWIVSKNFNLAKDFCYELVKNWMM